MIKKFFLAVLFLLALAGSLVGIKALQIKTMIEKGKSFAPPPEAVTTCTVRGEQWETLLNAIGSVEAVQGVTITAELAGKVEKVEFTAGAMVKTGDLLLKQDTMSEEAQLRSAEASVALSKSNLARVTSLLAQKTVSQSEYDTAEAQYKAALAQCDNIRASITKKIIKAPFSGRLGIREVNLGQNLTAGQTIVSLQALDPIYVDFQLPQREISKVSEGFSVHVSTDAYPGQEMEGKITVIAPEADPVTRNVKMQASLRNPQGRLLPGMYVNVEVVLPEKEKVLSIPATSVLYAPYSDSVYLVEEKANEKTGKMELALRQQFVKLGKKRGDFVAVVSGLSAGQSVVSTGAFKLRNGQSVLVNNALAPDFKLNPAPEDN